MAKEESGLQSGQRNLGSSVLKFLGNVESAGQFFDPVGNIVGALLGSLGVAATGGKESPAAKISQLSNELGFQQNTPQLLEQSQVLPENYLTPRNVGEKYLQNVLSQAPLAALDALSSGSRVLPSLLPNILGNVAAQGGEAAGLGDVGQQALQLATELGTGITQGGFKPGGLKKKAKSLYEKAKIEFPENSRTSGEAISSGIKAIEEALKTQTEGSRKTKLEDLKKTLVGLVEGSENNGFKVNPKEILETRRNLNRQIRESPESLIELLIPTRNALNEALTDAAVQYPLQIGDIRAADQIYIARNIPRKFTDFFERTRKNIPTKILKSAWDVADAALTAIYQPIRGYKMIKKYPEVMKYYKEMGRAATKNNINAVIRFGEKINDVVKKSKDIDDTVDLDNIF